MPTSARGNNPARRLPALTPAGRSAGFTLIELLVVVAIVALAAGLVSVAIRDPQASRLDQEAVRLAALLDAARAESRAAGVAVLWAPVRPADRDAAGAASADFRFVGLPPRVAMPTRWLDPQTGAELIGTRAIVLGPEPLIGPQRIVLSLGDRRLSLTTDGLGPFVINSPGSEEGRR
jgi:general secretion pathway protein H